MKILFVSIMANFSKFNRPYMKWFQAQGWTVHYASLGEEKIPYCHASYALPFSRSPYSLTNFKAYFSLKRIIEQGNYDCIHCHTPMGGVLTRLAARNARRRGVKVLYTAHGFHFYKGAPVLNNLIYKNAERFCANYCDAIITINQEDFESAKRFRGISAQNIHLIPGVGVDTQKIHQTRVNQTQKRASLGIPEDAVVVLTIAELIERKNYAVALAAFAKAYTPNTYYLICGVGVQQEKLIKMTRDLHIENNVVFAGYRHDIAEIVHICDIKLFVPRQEGLGLGALEAMAAGLPLIASDIRGITEYAQEGESGYLCDPLDVEAIAEAIRKLQSSPSLRERFGANNREIAKKFDLHRSLQAMEQIYYRYLDV